MPHERYLGLLHGQGLAIGHKNLPFHQIKAGDHFGNRVLYLQARVHLHEVEVTAGVQKKLHRACAHVVNGLGAL